jgi:hypothetical protein
MVDRRVVKRLRGGHRFFKTQHFGLVVKTCLNRDRAGPLGERWDAWLCPHCFIGWLGREAGYGPVDRSATRCGLCREPFFSRAVSLLNFVNDSWKVATYGDCPQEAYTGRKGTGVGSVRGVLVGFFPCRVYIDLNHRDSRIWVTAYLWQSSRS